MPSIGVLEHNQKPTDKPRRIKKSGGQSLVNQGKADWVIRNVLLKMRPVSENRIHSGHHFDEKLVKTYIPEDLPANIDYKLGLTVQAPILANQIRFRPLADQRSHPAY